MSDITQSHIGQLTDVIPSAMPPTERAALPVAVTTTNTCCTTEIEATPIMTISSDADIPMSQ